MERLEKSLLSGMRILELTYGPSGSYAGRLYAESGAQVTKICSKSYVLSSFRDKGKAIQYTKTDTEFHAVVVDLLHFDWDIIIWDRHCNNELTNHLKSFLQKNNSHCTCIGIYMDFPIGISLDEEDSLQAVSGWMELTGSPDRTPLQVGGSSATSIIGAHAATAGLLALVTMEHQQNQIVQINALSICVSTLEGAYSTYLDTGQLRGRIGNRHHSLAPMAILPSRDGWVFVGAPVDEKWNLLEGWAELVHQSEWINADNRMSYCQRLEEELSKWTSTMSSNELFHTGQAFRMPFAMVQTLEEVRDCPHLKERSFWSTNNLGQSEMRLPWMIHLNNDGNELKSNRVQKNKPFRILDLTSMWSGPYCTRLFADLGIEVVKIEAPHRPDGIRSNQGIDAPFFRELNRNKLAIELDLNAEEDRHKFLELLKSSDVVVDNFSPRVMPNFGLQSEKLWRHQPELIHLSLSAFGQTGPYRDYVGYGPTLEVMSGIASLTHYDDGNPWLPGFSISDIGAGIHGAFALVSALYYRQTNRVGIRIDLSQYEAACQFIGENVIDSKLPEKLEDNEKIRNLQDVVNDKQVHKVLFKDGSSSIGMPWECESWSVPMRPPPEVGEHTKYIDTFLKQMISST
ncbi:CoA transferase [Bacillus massiliigorillae]|uniref:CoA transferase n=1 Tax=Bacillus massiliigorillae TaxID=1243664 RepID=UPI0003A9AC0D|nr:CoA transferase [Bacillus massiliigorillae]